MAPTIREVLVIPNSSTVQRTVTSGAGTQAADTFVIVQATDNTVLTDPTSTAGSLTQHGTAETDGNGNGLVKIWTTTASTGGAKDVVFPAAGGFDIFGVVLVMTGTVTPDGFAKVHFTSSGTSFLTPAVTLTNPNDLLVAVCYLPGNTVFDLSGSGLTEQAQNTALPFSSMSVGTAALTLSGTSPTYTVTTGAGVKPGIVAFGLTGSTGNVSLTGAGNLGALTGAASAVRTVIATGAANLGFTGTASAVRTVFATGTGNLGALTGRATIPAPPSVAGSGWGSLYALNAEFRQFARDEATRQPVACPNDGEPLRTGPDGQLYCKYDGWRPSR